MKKVYCNNCRYFSWRTQYIRYPTDTDDGIIDTIPHCSEGLEPDYKLIKCDFYGEKKCHIAQKKFAKL